MAMRWRLKLSRIVRMYRLPFERGIETKSVGSETAIFVPRGKRSDWIFINVFFFLLIYHKRKFCAEPMRKRLTFHFELRTRSGNFRFFFFFLFFLFVFSNQGKISSCNSNISTIDHHNYFRKHDLKQKN